MNYQRVYDDFIADRRKRESMKGQQRHHIIPRLLGGGDESDNLVRLSPEDHLFAHALLAKIHGGGKHWFSVAYLYERRKKSATPRMVKWGVRARKEGNKVRALLTTGQWAEEDSKIRVAVTSDEYRAKHSVIAKLMHARPGHKEKLRASMERVRPAITEKLREHFKSREARLAAGNGKRGVKQPAERVERRAASLSKTLQDPQRRKLYSDKQKAWSATPEGREAKRRAALARWGRQ